MVKIFRYVCITAEVMFFQRDILEASVGSSYF